MLEVQLPRAIDGPGALLLLDAIQRAADAPCHEAIVFTGGDGVFCEGLDLAPLISGDAAPDEVAAAVDTFIRCLALLRQSPKPTLALIDGAARGGGLGLAAACDVVVATEKSHFALPELLWGLLPAVIYPSLRERLTVQQCRLWVLIGGARTAADARAAGLVDEVVPDGALEQAGRRWRRHLSRTRPEAVARLRQFVSEDVTEPEAAARRGLALTTAALVDEELRARTRRFSAGGEPPWGEA